jgi:hypothetical protein
MSRYVLSSGLFGLPGNAASVDWAVVNNSQHTETFIVTIYQGGVNMPKTVIPPGVLSQTLKPGCVTHNANSVGPTDPFVPGFYYEVVVETNSLKVMPTVMVWEDHGAKVIPGTTILPGDFKSIK